MDRRSWVAAACAGLIGAAAAGGAALPPAGPSWVEPGDAGSVPGTAQLTLGTGALLSIVGTLEGTVAASGTDDFEDMYVIAILDPGTFIATTALSPGFAEFDSRLYLFDITGLGLLGNDDASSAIAAAPAGKSFGACCLPDGSCDNLFDFDCLEQGGEFQGNGTDCKFVQCPTGGASLGNASDDGTNVVITQPGLYLLAITVTPRFPVSTTGAIFDFASSSEVSGPDGPGGGDPIIDWDVPIPSAPAGGVPGDYTIQLSGTGFAQSQDIQLLADIKPGGCPNPLNRGSPGVLPVSLVGTVDFSAGSIALSTVRLSRADGVGGEVAPLEGQPGPHSVIADTATPFGGVPCACHALNGDGIPDLSMKFSIPALVAALQLDGLPNGTFVELKLTGTLQSGTPFAASDCVKLVPP